MTRPNPNDALLTINAGSSSIKFALFGLADAGRDEAPPPMVSGEIDGIGAAARFSAHDAAGAELGGRDWQQGADTTHEDVFATLLSWVDDHLGDACLAGVGHRVVHGGRKLIEPTRIDPAVMDELAALIPLAPLHQPHALHAIRAVSAVRPDLPQIACFDTAFHHTMPPLTRRYAIPRALHDEGIERYGFHGLSYEFIAGALRRGEPSLASGRVVVAHLGNGASLCGMRDGRSLDTTMGFTALEGLPMGTRSGAIDPGVILYLQQSKSMSAHDVETLLYHQSGLLGVSGISADMRTLIGSADPRAAEAIDLFAFRIARNIGALSVSLEGLDTLVFTAGIGEHTPRLRAKTCAHLRWLGIELDEPANARGARRISTGASRVNVLVIPTNEEAMIARHTAGMIA
jgi:acetate kinase